MKERQLPEKVSAFMEELRTDQIEFSEEEINKIQGALESVFDLKKS